MKFTLAIVALLSTAADAFAPVSSYGRSSTTTSLFSRADSSDLVKEALEISKKFGASSPATMSLRAVAVAACALIIFCNSSILALYSWHALSTSSTSQFSAKDPLVAALLSLASTYSAATKGSLAENCDVDDVDKACQEYNAKMEELQKMIKAQAATATALKDMVDNVKKVKLAVPEMKAAPASPKLQAALAEAKKVTAEKGIDSAEARVAWDAVEEIA
eukprot:CAMPEP_0178865326 /NCGR_PEP_ID=MMETSP0747-20121128/4362_1 /TAXON_ID=913974 /ORGANISM="Nitzschia punctata, Strain CCMP561" /LENGTH=218 /DNA_ID=CAMNT_0020532129 /DNA_START=121 /DNA_END=773 /DNA_ORIENTATION=+